MKAVINSDVTQLREPNDLTLTGTTIKDYEPLLYKMGITFGFDDKETSDLIQQVYAEVNRNKVEEEHLYALRICLSKRMTYKCVFLISSKFFSQNAGRESIRTSFKYYSEYKSSCIIESSNMPLSYRAAYILHHSIGFTEAEVSELLNITPAKAKDRIKKARSFINRFKG